MSLRRTGNVTINQMAPAVETAFAELPSSIPNPAIDGGHFERFSANPIIPLPTTGKVATAAQASIDLTNNTIAYTGDDPTDGNFYKVASSGTIPTGLAINTIYYARDTGAGTFKLASTIGGAAVDITGKGTGTLTITEYAWDRAQIVGVVEDPNRSRILLVVSGRRLNAAVIASAGADYNDGRELYLYSQPWSQPGAVATPLNDATHPLVPVGAVGAWAATDWDSGSIYSGGHSCCIVGNRLHIAYGGAIISGSMSQYLGHNRIGLAYFDLTGTESNPVATKVTTAACLHLGTTPYQGCGPSLSYLNGKFHMWVNQAPMAANGTTKIDVTNQANRSVLPRLYTSQSFSTTVGTNGWTAHPWMMEYGQNDDYQYNRGFQLMPYTSDGRKWLGMKYDSTSGSYGNKVFMVDIQSEQIEYTELARIIDTNTVAGTPDYGTVDNPTFLYHLGKWYYYGSGNYVADNIGNQIISAEYILTGTVESQAGFTPANRSYPRVVYQDNYVSFTSGVGEDAGTFPTGKVATVVQATGITVDAETYSVFTYSGDDIPNGSIVRLITSGTIPTGLALGLRYFVVSADAGANTLRLSLTAGGAGVDVSNAQTGNLTITEYEAFKSIDRIGFTIGGGIMAGGITRNRKADNTTTEYGTVRYTLWYPTKAHAHPAADTTAYAGSAHDTANHSPQAIITGKPV